MDVSYNNERGDKKAILNRKIGFNLLVSNRKQRSPAFDITL